MITRVINVNEYDVCYEPVEFVCYGLGSCIGLFIFDPTRRITGAAHIPLSSNAKTAVMLKGASDMIEQMLTRFKVFGIPSSKLAAKLAGGAKVVYGTQRIGEKNINTILNELNGRGIAIMATDVGGSISRTARFNSVTGDLTISTPFYKKYSI